MGERFKKGDHVMWQLPPHVGTGAWIYGFVMAGPINRYGHTVYRVMPHNRAYSALTPAELIQRDESESSGRTTGTD